MGTKGTIIVALGIFSLVFTGCQTGSAGGRRHAVAQLSPTQNNSVRGTVDFYETARGVRVVAHVTGLTPGKHGFHIHQVGDCSAPDASSAKDHFNPAGAKHGGPEDADRHAGDFGNITADPSGVARHERVETKLSFDGPNSILGRAVIVHANPDDLSSQPAGNAGARQACGVIQLR